MKKRKIQVESPAIQFVRLMWDKSWFKGWRSFNYCLQQALSLAIEAGFRFDLRDFELLNKHRRDGGFNFHFWGGLLTPNGPIGERYYNQACLVGNISACLAFEKYAGRPPFMYKYKEGKPRRLYVGAVFYWKNESGKYEEVRCTSFARNGEYLVACSYYPRKKPLSEAEVARVKNQHKITPSQLRAENRILKEFYKEEKVRNQRKAVQVGG